MPIAGVAPRPEISEVQATYGVSLTSRSANPLMSRMYMFFILACCTPSMMAQISAPHATKIPAIKIIIPAVAWPSLYSPDTGSYSAESARPCRYWADGR